MVLWLGAELIVGSWSHHGHLGRAEIKIVTGDAVDHLRVLRARDFHKAKIGGGRRIRADPELTRMKIRDDGGEPADVVGMRVGQGDRVEARDAARPQVRRDYVVTDIEIGVRECY